MPRFSAFTPFGHLRFSSAPSYAKVAYRDLCARHVGMDLTQGTDVEARLYATAMAMARVRLTYERAANQAFPGKSYDLLPLHERAFRVTPGARDTIPDRQKVVAAKALLPLGGNFFNIVASLRTLLGSDFIAYRPIATNEANNVPVTWTSAGTTKPNPKPNGLIPRFFKLDDAVTTKNTPITVHYLPLSAHDAPPPLAAGDVVQVQGENTGLSERVTIASVGSDSLGPTITATFTQSHDFGATVTDMDWPYWWSSQRFSYVIVTAAAAVDAEKRRKVHELMADLARGVSQWAIVQPSQVYSAGNIGGVRLNVTNLGTSPFEQFAYTPSP